MSESSEEKSKRKYVALLTQHAWKYQYSIFCQDPLDSVYLFDESKQLKQSIRRKFEVPLLLRYQLKKIKWSDRWIVNAFISVLAPEKLEGFEEYIEKCSLLPPYVSGKRLQPEKIKSMAASIANQRPHDLKDFFGKSQVKRFTVLNEQLLPTITHSKR